MCVVVASGEAFVSIGRAPVRRKGDQFVISISSDERQMVTQLLTELAEMLAEPESSPSSDALSRLFPVVYEADPEREAEYQRLMREELVASKLAAIESVTGALQTTKRNQMTVDEAGLVALMQSINSVRLVLGTIVDIEALDDLESLDASGDHDLIDEQLNSAEYQLYVYLSWLLDWCVTAIGGLNGRSEPT